MNGIFYDRLRVSCIRASNNLIAAIIWSDKEKHHYYLFISFNCWELAVFLSSPSTLPDLFQFFTGKDMSSVLLAKFGVLW